MSHIINSKGQSFFGEFEDTVTCPVCMDIFKNPQMLQCQHSVCAGCTHSLSSGNNIKCPKCQEQTPLDSLKTNLVIKQLVELYATSDVSRNLQKAQTNKLCLLCESRVITHYCHNCGRLLCELCKRSHSKTDACKEGNTNTLSFLVWKYGRHIEATTRTVHNEIAHLQRLRDDRIATLCEVGKQATAQINHAQSVIVQQVEKYFSERKQKVKDFVEERNELTRHQFEEDIVKFEDHMNNLQKCQDEEAVELVLNYEKLAKKITGDLITRNVREYSAGHIELVNADMASTVFEQQRAVDVVLKVTDVKVTNSVTDSKVTDSKPVVPQVPYSSATPVPTSVSCQQCSNITSGLVYSTKPKLATASQQQNTTPQVAPTTSQLYNTMPNAVTTSQQQSIMPKVVQTTSQFPSLSKPTDLLVHNFNKDKIFTLQHSTKLSGSVHKIIILGGSIWCLLDYKIEVRKQDELTQTITDHIMKSHSMTLTDTNCILVSTSGHGLVMFNSKGKYIKSISDAVYYDLSRDTKKIYALRCSDNKVILDLYTASGTDLEMTDELALQIPRVPKDRLTFAAVDDHFYVCSQLKHCVWKLNRTGQITHTYGKQGNGIGQLQYPFLRATDSRELVVADCMNNRLQCLDSDSDTWSVVQVSGVLIWPTAVTVDSAGVMYTAGGGQLCKWA